jgi:hypothetical protein
MAISSSVVARSLRRTPYKPFDASLPVGFRRGARASGCFGAVNSGRRVTLTGRRRLLDDLIELLRTGRHSIALLPDGDPRSVPSMRRALVRRQQIDIQSRIIESGAIDLPWTIRSTTFSFPTRTPTRTGPGGSTRASPIVACARSSTRLCFASVTASIWRSRKVRAQHRSAARGQPQFAKQCLGSLRDDLSLVHDIH